MKTPYGFLTMAII